MRLSFLAAAALVAALAAGCGSGHEPAAAPTTGETVVRTVASNELTQHGRLPACVDLESPPYAFTRAGRKTGFEVELLERIARRLGLGVVWVPTPRTELAAALKARKCDVIVSRLGYDLDTQFRLDVGALQYLALPLALVAPTGSSTAPVDIADLCGRRLAVVAWTAPAFLAREQDKTCLDANGPRCASPRRRPTRRPSSSSAAAAPTPSSTTRSAPTRCSRPTTGSPSRTSPGARATPRSATASRASASRRGSAPRCSRSTRTASSSGWQSAGTSTTRRSSHCPDLHSVSMSETAERQELWGAETRKAVANFPVSGEPIPVPVARWLGRIKAAAARVNAELGLLDADKAERIAAAGDRIAAGELDDQFPIDVFQTGSGTSSNMNANEVIAALAGEGVHANDDVNMGQSSNDVFPSAVHLAALGEITSDLLPALDRLASSFEAKAAEFDDVVKSGRTHLMDAVPVTLGQEFAGYGAQVRQGIARIESSLERLGQIPLGGTAVGTGLNTHPEFAERVRAKLSEDTGLRVLAARRPVRGAGRARRDRARPRRCSRPSPSR